MGLWTLFFCFKLLGCKYLSTERMGRGRGSRGNEVVPGKVGGGWGLVLVEKDSFGWGVHLDTRLQQVHSCLKRAVVDSSFRVPEKNFRFDFIILEVFGSHALGTLKQVGLIWRVKWDYFC